jgi:transposase
MPGLGQVLHENTRLREMIREKDLMLAAQSEQLERQLEQQRVLAQQVAELVQKVEALQASNELFSKHFEFLEKRRKLAAAERIVLADLQSPLFEGAPIAPPPRDPDVEKADAGRPAEPHDKRKTPKHQRKGRRDVAALHFPKKVVFVPLDEGSVPDSSDLARVDDRVTYRIGWEPGHYVVVEVRQEQRKRVADPESFVWTAPEPCLLPGAMCDDGLLVRVLVDKFGDHLPLNRQAARMTREGLPIGTNVLSGWVLNAHAHVRPLVRALRMQLASSSLLQGDDSGFPVQDGSDGVLANGRLWVFTDQKQAFFAFSRTKEGEHPAELFESLGFSGRLLVDGGSEFNQAERDRELGRAGCWSHLRRYFFNASIQHDVAKHGLTVIHDLFMVERDLVDLAPKARLAVRAIRSAPLVDGFYTWVKSLVPQVRPGSKLGEAVTYAINQEPRMRLFLSHGDVPIHNNLSELLLRQPIVGRKNWLFAGSEGGAEAAAGWFSLIASCRLQGIDPAVYLYDVFQRLPDHPGKWLHELTPLNWRLAVEAKDMVPHSPGDHWTDKPPQ